MRKFDDRAYLFLAKPFHRSSRTIRPSLLVLNAVGRGPRRRGQTLHRTGSCSSRLTAGARGSQSERFTGLLVGLLTATLTAIERGFEQMNEARKRRVEVT